MSINMNSRIKFGPLPPPGLQAILVVFGLILSFAFPLRGQQALLFYDGPEGRSEAFKSARFLQRLLGHFEIKQSRVASISHYKKGQAIQPDFLFLVFEEGQPEFSAGFLEDLSQRQKTTVWVNMHIDLFLEKEGEMLGFIYDDWEERTDWRVSYNGVVFPKEDPGLNRVKLVLPEKVKVLATVSDESRSFPYVLNSGHFWYVADSPFSYAYEGGRFLILADLLHDILGQNHPTSHQALVRIEDVNAEDDPEKLLRIGRWLEKREIPFAVSLIPIFRDPANQQEIRLSERPRLVAALKELVGRGATIVLHGATHQHQGRTAEDFEFWDDIVGQPIPHETKDWVEETIKLALEECFRCGLYPISWETPHYAASQEDYRLISQFFNTFYDRVMAAELVGSQQIFPYPAFLSDFQVWVIPENLGYIDFENPDARQLIEKARRMLAVRDGLASFFFHSFVPIKYLQQVCGAMKEMGWDFISVRDFGCQLRTDSAWVTSAGGEGEIELAGDYLHELLLDRNGRLVKEFYSEQPLQGKWPKQVELPRGYLYVLEAVPTLPPLKKSLAANLLAGFKTLVKPSPEQPLRLLTSAVLTFPNLNDEEKNDQASFLAVLRVFGLNPQEIGRRELTSLAPGRPDLLVVPYPAAVRLTPAEINRLFSFIEQGGEVITDGPSRFMERAGFKFIADQIRVRGLKETTIPAPEFAWATPAVVPKFSFESGTVLARDLDQNWPIAVLRPLGQGKVLFLVAPFDPLTPFGLSRYPYLAYYLKNTLGIPFSVRRNVLELYFDPGLRPQASLEKLVRHWRASGVKVIYLAAWHFYENYQFPYGYFIDLCHRFGLAVYAWLEFPYVTSLMWEKNPEWREKQVDGADARNGWRLPLNLFHPEAQVACRRFLRQLLFDYDWDGVNLAELSFDSDGGFLNPAKFTPFNEQVKQRFQTWAGYEMAELFRPESSFYWRINAAAKEKLLAFRSGLIQELHRLFLEEIEKIEKIKGAAWEVIVTNYDSLLHPEIREECGVETKDLIALMKDFDFTLQIEDPARSWRGLPSRYIDYINEYKKYVPNLSRLMFDLNVVPFRDVRGTPFPLPQACGAELATLVYLAQQASGRVAIYSEATILPLDLGLLPFVFGADVSIKKKADEYLIQSRRPFNLQLSSPGYKALLNGQPWPLSSAFAVTLPAGENRLQLQRESSFFPASLNCHFFLDSEMMEVEGEGSWYRLVYASSLPTTFSFQPVPRRLFLDGQELSVKLDQTSLVLPRGRHELRVFTETATVQTLKRVGYFSSFLFFSLGFLSVGLLLGCYLYIRIKR